MNCPEGSQIREIHCLGGFVAAFYYNLSRPTNDLDYIAVVPYDATAILQQLAGEGSALAAKHRLHFQHVGGYSRSTLTT